ncbi:TRAP transporter small permease subunit [Marivita hallyeonensis]|uniref:TRAP transporter small permease protein n=1 Tax=Marivita hallyeonensis TaxID=996342 RepID=A0A1M5R341_9RHOB|nr:TRAP transporter small permease subunit [Marivita hallyeonensis]SHH20558.1 TRAP-type mannitol/chloroaromatic compound transport system, small permease component [Marivita hallyeonensis]
MDKAEEVVAPDGSIAITDPGEAGREHHNRGDRFIVQVSNFFAWLFPILMLVICAQVVLRTLGRSEIGPGNQAWMDDLQWWIYGAAVLIGIGYAVTTNSHVRVDIFYDNFPKRKKYKYEIFALGWLFLPFIILCWDVTLGYAIASVAADEGSDSPNGLHNLWMLKVFMNVSFLFVAVAIWAAYIRYLSGLTDPVLWKKLLFAFPSTMFAINLAIYYALWWAVYLTGPADMTTRDVGRHAIFGEFDLGPWEMKYTIVITIVLTLVVIGVARLLDRSDSATE